MCALLLLLIYSAIPVPKGILLVWSVVRCSAGRRWQKFRPICMTGLVPSCEKQNHLTTNFEARILSHIHSGVLGTVKRSILRSVPGGHPNNYKNGASLESNFNQQPYRGPDERLARCLRRRHAPGTAKNGAACYHNGLLCRLVERHGLQRRRDGELQRR